MSVFTWGKIKFKNTPKKNSNFVKEDIWVMFDLPDPKNCSLHISKLEENEVYFDILCDYSRYRSQDINISPIDYANNDIFLSVQYTKKNQEKDTPILSVDLYLRLKKLQSVLEELLNLPELQELTFFNTEMGPLCKLEDYRKVNWKLEDFAYEFLKAMNEADMLTPTIQVVFKSE